MFFIYVNIYIDVKAWSLSKKSSEKEKERSKLLSALAKKPAVSSEAMSGKTKKVVHLLSLFL